MKSHSILYLAFFLFALPQQPVIEPFEILSYKIGTDYNPMLDRKSAIAQAESSDYPRVDGEVPVRSAKAIRMEAARSRGRLRSELKIINQAEWVKLTLKNNHDKATRSVHWSFAFPRFVNGELALRYDVSTRIEIKPGGKQTLKQPLPEGASRCKAIVVSAEKTEKEEKARTFEAVCGPGLQDPSKLKDQQSVVIKRIEYADGSVWEKN